MLIIPEFKLHSFTVGCKHTRAFSVDNVGGVIADYVLGECGVEDSPLPKGFYDKVGVGEGVELTGNERTHYFRATRDRVVIAERTSKLGESLNDVEKIVKQAQHLVPGTFAFMNKPKVMFLGMVWEFAEESIKEREKFKHPAAEDLANKVVRLKLGAKEYPSEVNVRISFRKKIPESWVLKGKNDYINVILTIRDASSDELWPPESEKKKASRTEEPRIRMISVDIQRMLDPQRVLTGKLFNVHWEFCQQHLKSRLQGLLEEIGFGKVSER